MGFGGGIFLLVLGGILAFAVKDSWDVIDLTVIGYICIAAGILAIILGLVTSQRRRTSETVVQHTAPPAAAPPAAARPGETVVREEHRDGI
ncbi:hypothetical protein GCM10028777_15790 [Angustibacter speluncae]